MSDFEHEKYEHAGQTIRIMADDCDRESPRDWDNLGTILYSSSHYTLGDVQVSDWEGEFYDLYDREPQSWQDWAMFVMEHRGATHVLPVYAYIHGGCTISVGEGMDSGNPFSCPWDSGLAGIIFDTAERREVCGTPADRIVDCLKGEVKTFDQWMTGEVYGYIVETEDDDHADSCWGFYDIDDAKSEAESAAEYHRDKAEKKAHELARMDLVWRH